MGKACRSLASFSITVESETWVCDDDLTPFLKLELYPSWKMTYIMKLFSRHLTTYGRLTFIVTKAKDLRMATTYSAR